MSQPSRRFSSFPMDGPTKVESRPHPEILVEVRKLNKLSKVELNTIALGGANNFMQRLAQQNNGVCVHVK